MFYFTIYLVLKALHIKSLAYLCHCVFDILELQRPSVSLLLLYLSLLQTVSNTTSAKSYDTMVSLLCAEYCVDDLLACHIFI